MKLTWFEQLERVPPKLLRIFAITGSNNRYRRLKTREEIARDGGLAQSTVAKVDDLGSWKTIRMTTILAYIQGCGVDPLNRPHIRERMRLYSRQDRKQHFLRNSSPDQRKMVKRILDGLRSERNRH